MSKHSDVSNVTRRDFLVGAGSLATTGYLVIGGAPSDAATPSAQSGSPDHVMTFDVTQTPIACIIEPSQPEPDLCVLTVNPKEVVCWKAKTAKKKHHLAVLFADRTPFVDKDGDKVWAFHGTDIDEGNGIGRYASIDPSLSQGDYFEFSVGIWDENDANKIKSYTGDPTIMIGKGGSHVASAAAKLTAANGLLMQAAAAYPPESDEIRSIEDKVTAVIVKLQAILKGPSKY